MKFIEFVAECVKRLIDFQLAAENEDIKQALIARDDAKVIELLDSEY